MMIMLPDGLWVQRPGLPSCYAKDGFEGWCIPLTPETGEEVLPSPPHPSTCLTQQQQQQQQQQQLQQQLFL